MTDIRQQILDVLNSNEDFVSTDTLVKTLGYPRPSINSELYKMMAAKLVEKRTNDKGGNPEWRSLSGDRESVVAFLNDNDKPVPTLAISKHIFGPKATTKDINPTLYALEKEGIVIKTTDTSATSSSSTKPHWSLVKKNDVQNKSINKEEIMSPANLVLAKLKRSRKPISYDKIESDIDLDSETLFETLTDLYNSDQIIQLVRTDTDTQYWALESHLLS